MNTRIITKEEDAREIILYSSVVFNNVYEESSI